MSTARTTSAPLTRAAERVVEAMRANDPHRAYTLEEVDALIGGSAIVGLVDAKGADVVLSYRDCDDIKMWSLA